MQRRPTVNVLADLRRRTRRSPCVDHCAAVDIAPMSRTTGQSDTPCAIKATCAPTAVWQQARKPASSQSASIPAFEPCYRLVPTTRCPRPPSVLVPLDTEAQQNGLFGPCFNMPIAIFQFFRRRVACQLSSAASVSFDSRRVFPCGGGCDRVTGIPSASMGVFQVGRSTWCSFRAK